MYTTAAATRSFVYSTARAADAGRANRKDCAAVILYAAEKATRMALDAIQILGGNGCARCACCVIKCSCWCCCGCLPARPPACPPVLKLVLHGTTSPYTAPVLQVHQ